jgi:hypothetical protein
MTGRVVTRLVAPLLLLAGVLVGILVCQTVEAIQQPHCPTEDSCTVDYRDGRWHITEDTP